MHNITHLNELEEFDVRCDSEWCITPDYGRTNWRYGSYSECSILEFNIVHN